MDILYKLLLMQFVIAELLGRVILQMDARLYEKVGCIIWD